MSLFGRGHGEGLWDSVDWRGLILVTCNSGKDDIGALGDELAEDDSVFEYLSIVCTSGSR